MDRFGGWWRPWHYGDVLAEYWAVREAVSIGDVSTLGKLVVSGPDVVEALERLYPCHVADIKPGRSRYALLLNERGHVMDDGMILRESETRFALTFTSGGAANAEMWLRDWIETWGLRVHVLDRTMSLAAINVTGPLAGELLQRLGLADPPRFLGHVHAEVAGVPCHVMRLSFTGEAAFELHHPIDRSVELWRALMDAGARPRDPAARPPGAVRAPAREGPRHRRHGHRARHDAAPARHGLGGPDGQAVLHRPDRAGADGRDARRPPLGRVHDARPGAGRGQADLRRRRREIVGHVTGSWTSPVLGEGADARLAAASAVRRTASRSTAARPSSRRPRSTTRRAIVPALEPLPGLRVVADPAALDALVAALPAPRALFASRPTTSWSIGTAGVVVDDPDAIVEPETGFVARPTSTSRSSPATWSGRSRPSARRSPRARSPACRPSSGWSATTDGRRSLTAAAYADELAARLGLLPMSEYTETLPPLRWADEPKPAYDVVIVGGGGHGLATAYYLATRHGITNVAVLEADYIASGNTGRNTTIIRANYGIPEAIRFYQHSLELYQGLEAETGAAILHQTKGIVWLAHTEMAMRTERAGCLMNTACGAKTVMLTPAEIKELVPQIDLTGGGRYPVLGASHHVEGGDRPPRPGRLGLRGGAIARGVDVFQHTPVTGLLRDGDRVVGVETSRGPIAAGVVLSRGRRPGDRRWPPMAGVRLPVRTHPLHAFVTNDYAQGFPIIVASTELACYVSQTERGQMLIGAEFDAQPSYSRQSSFAALRSYAYKITRLLPFLRELRILRHVGRHLRHLGRLQPDHGRDRRRRASSSRPAGGRGASRRSRPAARRWPS